MEEIWKDIEGYEGLYQVSNLGRVKSLSIKIHNRVTREKILMSHLSNSGYQYVCLSNNKIKKYLFVHRIVALEFIYNPKSKEQVNHIDGNKSNNCIENLEWLSRSENMKHAYKNGLNRISDLQKQKTSEAKSSSVIDLLTGVVYKSIREANKVHKMPYTTLCYMLRNDIKNNTSLQFLKRRIEN
jgi:hypothetical protein